jgi:hypothetical protein
MTGMGMGMGIDGGGMRGGGGLGSRGGMRRAGRSRWGRLCGEASDGVCVGGSRPSEAVCISLLWPSLAERIEMKGWGKPT